MAVESKDCIPPKFLQNLKKVSIRDFQTILICGTSTGGIIALGVSAKIPMKDIVEFYENYGPKIFASKWKRLGIFGYLMLGFKQAICKSWKC